MSDTPRTDREVYTITERDIGFQAVGATLCRMIERELAEALRLQSGKKVFRNESGRQIEVECRREDGGVFFRIAGPDSESTNQLTTREAAVLHAALGECLQVGRELSGAEAIAAERVRQMEVEKWNTDHDDDHEDASLTHAALCYARLATFQIEDKPYAPILRAGAPIDWPWTPDSYKPKDARRNLVRAGALIAAEIDRLDRAGKLQSVACTKEADRG